MELVRDAANRNLSNRFHDENNFDHSEFKVLFSITKAQFTDLFTYCDPVPDNNNRLRRVYKEDLLLFLYKFHHGLSDDCLRIMFSYTTR